MSIVSDLKMDVIPSRLVRRGFLISLLCVSFFAYGPKAEAQEAEGYGKVRGNISFAGRPITEVTKARVELLFKNYPGKPIVNSPWDVTESAYQIFDAPLRPFGIIVWVNANLQNAIGLPGDFEAEVNFDLKKPGEVLQQDIPLTQIIQLLKPADNAEFLSGELAQHDSPTEFVWEPISEATRYQCKISVLRGDGTESEFVSEMTKKTAWKTELPDNKEGESYKFSLEAFLGNQGIGSFSVRRDAGGGITPRDSTYEFVVGEQTLRLAHAVQQAQPLRRLQQT